METKTNQGGRVMHKKKEFDKAQLLFSDRLRALRKKSGLTQEEIAAILEISKNTYSSYENNAFPKTDCLIRLAREFGVSIDYLLTGKGFSNEHQILSAFNDCPSEKLPHVLKVVRTIVESYQ